MVSNGRSLHFAQALLPAGWANDVRVTIASGLITAVESDCGPRPDDERHTVGVPGLANVHSHAFQRGMAGLAEVRGPVGDSFWTWRETMYRFVDRLSPDHLRAIAALAFVEMLETGFTRVGEFHYLHHDHDGRSFADPATMGWAIAEAAAETGIALTLLPVFYAHSGFGGLAPEDRQRRFVHDIDGFATLLDASRRALSMLPDAVLGIAPHSLRAVTPDELSRIIPLADGGPVHIHVAETLREVNDCLAWFGMRPVEWLFNNVQVDRQWSLIHATHMTKDETSRLAVTGAIAALCPITEANLGDGLFPADQFIQAGGQFGIGSDSNVMISAAEELRMLEYGQRLMRNKRSIIASGPGASTGETLFRAAAAGGAQSLGVSQGIEASLPADIVSLATDHPSLVARRGCALLDGLVFAAAHDAIDCVWRRGEKLVSRGRHCDRDRIVNRYRVVLEKLTA